MEVEVFFSMMFYWQLITNINEPIFTKEYSQRNFCAFASGGRIKLFSTATLR